MSSPSRLRPLDVPHPARVETDGEGRPVALHDGGHRSAKRGGRRALRGGRRMWAVAAIRETWRIDDEWWRRPISRLYFAVVLENGRPVTLYRDLRSGRWFLQGGGA